MKRGQLSHVCSQGESKDVLFLSTERYKFCVIEYDAETNSLQTRYSLPALCHEPPV